MSSISLFVDGKLMAYRYINQTLHTQIDHYQAKLISGQYYVPLHISLGFAYDYTVPCKRDSVIVEETVNGIR